MKNVCRPAMLMLAISSVVIGEVALPDSRPCRLGGADEWEMRSLDEMVEAADVVAFVRVADFTQDDSVSGFDGYYEFDLISDLMGELPIDFKLYGSEPYSSLPQAYIDVTAVHNHIDLDRMTGGLTGYLEQDGRCKLLPKFHIGFNYIAILGVQSRLAFEPIHSPHLDNWFISIRQIVLGQ